jgi:hypothetical protein
MEIRNEPSLTGWFSCFWEPTVNNPVLLVIDMLNDFLDRRPGASRKQVLDSTRQLVELVCADRQQTDSCSGRSGAREELIQLAGPFDKLRAGG